MAQIIVADISRWQGDIDFDTFKNYVSAIIIKSSGADGGLYPDSKLIRNQSEARRVGLPVAYYHYKGGGYTAEQQADYMLATVGEIRAGEFVIIDDENLGAVDPVFCRAFADHIKERTGLVVPVYSNLSRFQAANLAPISELPAWVAKYGLNTGNRADSGNAPQLDGMTIVCWQYTSRAVVPGCSANTVDMNVFYGSVDDFKALGAKGTVPAPTTPPPTPQPAPAQKPVSVSQYIVQSRDSDGLIALCNRLGISDWKGVAKLNNLDVNYTIRVGQVLQLPTNGQVTESDGTYTVTSRDYDGLAAAMARIGVSNWQAVAEHNGLNAPYTIHAGDVLRLPGGTPSLNNSRAFYIVKSSDSDGLAAAMKRIGISNWQAVAALNKLDAQYHIYPNQKLWLN